MFSDRLSLVSLFSIHFWCYSYTCSWYLVILFEWFQLFYKRFVLIFQHCNTIFQTLDILFFLVTTLPGCLPVLHQPDFSLPEAVVGWACDQRRGRGIRRGCRPWAPDWEDVGVGRGGSVGHGPWDEDGLAVLRGCSILEDVSGRKLCAGQCLWK